MEQINKNETHKGTMHVSVMEVLIKLWYQMRYWGSCLSNTKTFSTRYACNLKLGIYEQKCCFLLAVSVLVDCDYFFAGFQMILRWLNNWRNNWWNKFYVFIHRRFEGNSWSYRATSDFKQIYTHITAGRWSCAQRLCLCSLMGCGAFISGGLNEGSVIPTLPLKLPPFFYFLKPFPVKPSPPAHTVLLSSSSNH